MVSIAVVVLFAACDISSRQLPGARSTTVHGVPVVYSIASVELMASQHGEFALGAVSYGRWRCSVWIRQDVLARPRTLTRVIAHEVGHCLDWFALDYSHNGFTNEGCAYGQGWCPPAEGYAETWARLYLSRCGYDLAPLGWGTDRAKCLMPLPHEATPDAVLALP